jgi:hypothetical protein
MSKFIIGLLIGTVIATVAAFLVVPFHLKNSLVQYSNPNHDALEQKAENGTYNEKINSILQKAESSLEDEELRQFYRTLIRDYELESQSENTTSGAENAILPDFQKIFRESLTTPFEEAAQDITDEELAEAYDNVLKGVLGTTASVD